MTTKNTMSESDTVIFRRQFQVVASTIGNDPNVGKTLVHEYTESDLTKMFEEWDEYCSTLIMWAKQNGLNLPPGMPDQTPRK